MPKVVFDQLTSYISSQKNFSLKQQMLVKLCQFGTNY